jgi:hypothetical protein
MARVGRYRQGVDRGAVDAVEKVAGDGEQS